MQLSVRCKYCGHIYLNEREDELCLEFDFSEEEIRYLCMKCKKDNIIKLRQKRREESALPAILVG